MNVTNYLEFPVVRFIIQLISHIHLGGYEVAILANDWYICER